MGDIVPLSHTAHRVKADVRIIYFGVVGKLAFGLGRVRLYALDNIRFFKIAQIFYYRVYGARFALAPEVIVHRVCGKYPRVGAKYIVGQILEKFALADFIPPYKVVQNDGIVQVVQISVARFGRGKFKPLGKTAPDKIVGNGRSFPQFFAVGAYLFVYERAYAESDVSAGKFLCKFSRQQFGI